jgi:hypothetical protein
MRLKRSHVDLSTTIYLNKVSFVYTVLVVGQAMTLIRAHYYVLNVPLYEPAKKTLPVRMPGV